MEESRKGLQFFATGAEGEGGEAGEDQRLSIGVVWAPSELYSEVTVHTQSRAVYSNACRGQADD